MNPNTEPTEPTEVSCLCCLEENETLFRSSTSSSREFVPRSTVDLFDSPPSESASSLEPTLTPGTSPNQTFCSSPELTTELPNLSVSPERLNILNFGDINIEPIQLKFSGINAGYVHSTMLEVCRMQSSSNDLRVPIAYVMERLNKHFKKHFFSNSTNLFVLPKSEFYCPGLKIGFSLRHEKTLRRDDTEEVVDCIVFQPVFFHGFKDLTQCIAGIRYLIKQVDWLLNKTFRSLMRDKICLINRRFDLTTMYGVALTPCRFLCSSNCTFHRAVLNALIVPINLFDRGFDPNQVTIFRKLLVDLSNKYEKSIGTQISFDISKPEIALMPEKLEVIIEKIDKKYDCVIWVKPQNKIPGSYEKFYHLAKYLCHVRFKIGCMFMVPWEKVKQGFGRNRADTLVRKMISSYNLNHVMVPHVSALSNPVYQVLPSMSTVLVCVYVHRSVAKKHASMAIIACLIGRPEITYAAAGIYHQSHHQTILFNELFTNVLYRIHGMSQVTHVITILQKLGFQNIETFNEEMVPSISECIAGLSCSFTVIQVDYCEQIALQTDKEHDWFWETFMFNQSDTSFYLVLPNDKSVMETEHKTDIAVAQRFKIIGESCVSWKVLAQIIYEQARCNVHSRGPFLCDLVKWLGTTAHQIHSGVLQFEHRENSLPKNPDLHQDEYYRVAFHSHNAPFFYTENLLKL